MIGTSQMRPSRTLMCGIAGEIDVLHQRRHHLPRTRALHGDHRPLLGDRCQPDAQFGKLGLQIVFHVMQHSGRAAGRRGDVEAIGRQARDDAIVHHEAVLAQQHARSGSVPAQAG